MGSNNGHEKTSLIISILSAFIAVCALALSMYMGWLQKINYEISVQPYITLIPTVDPKKKEYGFYIYNAGMGKGYIENVEFFINGRKVEGNNLDALKKVINYFGFNENCFAYGNPRKGDSVSLEEINTLLAIGTGVSSLEQCKETYHGFYKVLNLENSPFTIKLKYRSIYNIFYLYDSSNNTQKKI